VSTRNVSRRPGRRIRRTADEAYRRILDATERRLVRGGPEAVRLLDIAADVGVSHSAILHHFRSRERLLAALARRAMGRLQSDLLQILATRRAGDPPLDRAARAARMFDAIHRLFAGGGHARLFAGLILSGRRLEEPMRATFGDFARAMHDNRVRRRREDRRPAPSWEDTAFSLTFGWIALFGDALFGPIARAMVGLPSDSATGARFREWLARQIEGVGEPGRLRRPRQGPRAAAARSRTRR
jgi:AcrR family transcriptional regulator